MKEQILIVDDEELMLSSYELFFSEKYDVTLARDAHEALRILEKKSNFAVILSDYDMPGMTGVELLNKTKDKYPDIVRVLMTAMHDIKIVSDAVNESNIFRFLIKNVDLGKFDKAISDAIEIHKVLRNEKKLKAELQSTYDRLERDLKAAAQLQQDIQPPASTIEGYSFVPLYMPSEFLSGDNFNYFQFEDWIFFYVLDVTGSGIPASMMSFTISKMLNSDKVPTNPILEIKNGKYYPKSPKSILSTLNTTFLTKDEDFQFFTILFGVIDIKMKKYLLQMVEIENQF